MFDALRLFVWPKYREEGPPEFVQSILLGRDILGEGVKLDAPARSILEMMTIGYRPVTSLAILNILNDTPNLAMHGMQIARELEKRFKVQEGWFTRTRYYTDRVGKLLPLLTRLGLVQDISRKDSRTGRIFTAYQITPSLKEQVTARLDALSQGERLSLFPSEQALKTVSSYPSDIQKECKTCGTISSSSVPETIQVLQPLRQKSSIEEGQLTICRNYVKAHASHPNIALESP